MRVLRIAFVLLVALAGSAGADDVKPRPARQHEVLTERPSGFWTSNRPAKNGAYRWRLLGLGIAIAGITGLATWRLVKRANAARAARQ